MTIHNDLRRLEQSTPYGRRRVVRRVQQFIDAAAVQSKRTDEILSRLKTATLIPNDPLDHSVVLEFDSEETANLFRKLVANFLYGPMDERQLEAPTLDTGSHPT